VPIEDVHIPLINPPPAQERRTPELFRCDVVTGASRPAPTFCCWTRAAVDKWTHPQWRRGDRSSRPQRSSRTCEIRAAAHAVSDCL